MPRPTQALQATSAGLKAWRLSRSNLELLVVSEVLANSVFLIDEFQLI